MKHIYLLLTVIFFNISYFSQGKIGDDLFDNFEYAEAIKFYTQDDNLTLNQKENLAYCYYLLQDFKKAEPLYSEIIKSDEVEPVFLQFYAISLKNNEKFSEANTYFKQALEKDSSLLASIVGLESLKMLPQLKNKKQLLETIAIPEINNGAATYAPIWYKNGILYASELTNDSVKRRPQIDINDDYLTNENLAYGNAERPISAIYYLELSDNEIVKNEIFARNDKFHIGNHTTPNSDNEIIFSKIDLINKWDPNVRNHPRLFKGTIENGTLIDVKKLSIKKLSNEVGSGHPVLSSDGKTLYFASDMPGGYGGSDLYKTILDENNKWSKPENLGSSINSERDELTPYIYEDYFYFASNGHPGYGGLDMYKISLSELTSGEIELLDAPINSPSDDHGLIISDEDANEGYICSNRFGGNGDDDLYRFQKKIDGFLVQGNVKDLDGNPVENSIVKIYDAEGNEIAQTKTDKNGRYEFIVPEETIGDFELIATIPGFGDKENITLNDSWDNSGSTDLILEPILTVQGNVLNEDGSPAKNTQVSLLDDAGNVIYKGVTDSLGYYQFPLEDELTMTILAQDGNLSDSKTFTTNDSYNTLEDKDLVLKEESLAETFVEGIVYDENGNPKSGVEIKLYDEEGVEIATTTTDQDGKYHFDLEKDKNYQLVAETEGFRALENIYTGDNFNPEDGVDLHLEPVGLESFALVTDRSSNKSIENVKVTLVDNETGKKFITYTDNEGKFTIYINPNKSYTINLEKDKYFPRSVAIKSGEDLPEKVDLNKMGDFGLDYAGTQIDKIYFDLNKFNILPKSKIQLDQLITILKNNPKADVTIKSYADCRGGNTYNISLSWKRSASVKKYLTANGISSSRILTKSLGATNFVNNCITPDACTEQEHSLNRRSEFEIDFNK